jgi:hypothetical protein
MASRPALYHRSCNDIHLLPPIATPRHRKAVQVVFIRSVGYASVGFAKMLTDSAGIYDDHRDSRRAPRGRCRFVAERLLDPHLLLHPSRRVRGYRRDLLCRMCHKTRDVFPVLIVSLSAITTPCSSTKVSRCPLWTGEFPSADRPSGRAELMPDSTPSHTSRPV